VLLRFLYAGELPEAQVCLPRGRCDIQKSPVTFKRDQSRDLMKGAVARKRDLMIGAYLDGRTAARGWRRARWLWLLTASR
jgi:hypothetical protein